MKKNQLIILAILFIGILQSCEKDPVVEIPGKYEEGIFVVNEGNFQQGNASLSFIDKDLNSIENNVYFTVNELQLGDQAQSITFLEDKNYIVVSGSNKIEVTEGDTMERLATIASDLEVPRYAVEIPGNKVLVSCWGDPSVATDDYLALIDAENDVVVSKIPVALGPEQLDLVENYLFVAHRGAWGTNNIVSVIDLFSLEVLKTIEVGDRPNSLVHDDNYLWVLSGGEPSWTGNETGGKLTKIDLTDFSVVQNFDFPQNVHPAHLSKTEDNLFYNIDNSIYKMNISDTALPSSSFMEYSGIMIYNMEANDGKIFITDAKDYQQEGDVIIYSATDGTKIKEFTAGIIPGDLGFKN